ncbi:LacI family transcriptional regulator [Endozoicomonas sp. Mp262]|uniref:LacI family DNA-binding transcriptional regulator n=1 Tax=Endozoicomonas sp. Mp262 TaxID=2919499 RepID=UPI0021D91E62
MPNNPFEKASAADVARALGVSTATISRAFTPGARISEKTRVRVLEKARELGYQQNIIAKMLNTRKSRLIGLVTGQINQNPYYTDVVATLTLALHQKGYQMILFSAQDVDDVSEQVLQAMQYQVEAIVIVNGILNQKSLQSLSGSEKPIIVIAPLTVTIPSGSNIHFVSGDHQRTGRLAAEILLARGYRKISIVTGAENNPVTYYRYKGCQKQLQHSGVVPNHIKAPEDSYDAGIQAAMELCFTAPYPDAVICTSDILAMGVMDGIRYRKKLSIPDDIGVISMDGISPARYESYDITTISSPVVDEVRCIVDIISGRSFPSKNSHLFLGELIEGSTLILKEPK